MSVCLSVCPSVCVCVTFTVLSDCEYCTRSISLSSEFIEAGDYWLTRGTCFVARRLEVVAVTGMLWISLCVLGVADFYYAFLFFYFVFFRAHPTYCEYEATLPHVHLLYTRYSSSLRLQYESWEVEYQTLNRSNSLRANLHTRTPLCCIVVMAFSGRRFLCYCCGVPPSC